MRMLYDSESFCVTHLLAHGPAAGAEGSPADGTALHPALLRHGFEIIDKRHGRELYLDGSWAELFQQQIAAWQASTPTQEEVELTLAGYAELAQNPLVFH